MRELPTLTLFKINMNLEMEKGTDALAAAVEAAPPRELEAQPYDDDDIAVIQALQGPMAAVERPYDEAAAEVGIDDRGAARAPARRWSTARSCAASRRSSTTAAPASRPTGWASGRCPRTEIMEVGAPHGLLPRHLPLLPAADLRGLALQRLHDGPRPLQGGVRRDPRLDRRGLRDRPRRPRHPLLLDRVQEDPPALLHRRLRRAGRPSIPSVPSGAVRARAAGSPRRRQLAGAGDAADRPRPDLHRARRGLRAGRRRRQPLPRLGRLLGPADPRPRRARGRRGGDRGGQAGDQLRRRDRGRGRAGRGGRRPRPLGRRWCG